MTGQRRQQHRQPIRRPRVSEHALQLAIAAELALRLPPGVVFTAVDHAAKLSPRQAGERKRRGVKRGQADFRFVLPPDGQSGEIELKADDGRRFAEQRAWEQGVRGAGGLYAVCRSMAEVEGTLAGWGVQLRGRAA